jgi:hypothetical protein
MILNLSDLLSSAADVSPNDRETALASATVTSDGRRRTARRRAERNRIFMVLYIYVDRTI